MEGTSPIQVLISSEHLVETLEAIHKILGPEWIAVIVVVTLVLLVSFSVVFLWILVGWGTVVRLPLRQAKMTHKRLKPKPPKQRLSATFAPSEHASIPQMVER